MSNNKFKSVLASDTFRSIASAVICALVGIIVGFIILLIINAEHAPKAISVILFICTSIFLQKYEELSNKPRVNDL